MSLPSTTNLTNLKANAFTDVVSTIVNTTSIISTTPKVTSITYPGDDTAANTGGGQTITVTGTGFSSGASILINATYAGVVTVVSNTTITFTSPAQNAGTYTLYVINSDGGTAISIPGISYSGTPTWTTAAGSLGTSYETAAISNSLTATGDPTISYSLYSGTLPPGSSLNSSTGLLSGTSQATASSTTYNFTIRATDGQNQDTDRAFSITISPDVVSWSSPADNSSTSVYEYATITPVTLAASSAAGKSITYTANTLPTGLTISGNTISGTPTVVANTFTQVTANSANTFRTATKDISFIVNPDVVTWSSPADGTSTSLFADTAMSNVTLSATSAAGKSITYTANTLPTGVTITGAVVNGTPTTVGTTNSLITATAATTNRTATRNFTWVVSVGSDTYFKNVSLLLNGETTVTPFISDASTNSLALNINGDTKPVLFNPYQEGYYSFYNPGTTDTLGFANNVALQLGTTYTIEGWGYLLAYGTNLRLFSDGSNDSTNAEFYVASNGTFGVSGGSATSSQTFPLNTWTHVAMVVTAGVLKVYINGVQATMSGTTTGYNNTSTSVRAIGGMTVSSYLWTGYISNIRYVKGTAVYSANFTPPSSPLTAISGTVLLTAQSNRYKDNSTNAFTPTVATTTVISPAIPFTANSSYSTYGSGYFDGTGDYLTVPSSTTSALNLQTGTCIEGWSYITSISTYGFIISSVQGAGGFVPWWYVGHDNAGNWRCSPGDATDNNLSSYPMTKNVWNHFALTNNGTTSRLFVNGVLIYTKSVTPQNTDQNFTFSQYGPTNQYLITGYVSDVRIIKGSANIPANYVTSSVTLGTSIFTPPTTPLTAITGTSLLTLQYNGGATNSGIIDNSNFNNIITRNGNVSQGTFSPYSQNGWSNYFDGASYLSLPDTGTMSFGTGSFTFEFWVNPTTDIPAYTKLLTGGASGTFTIETQNTDNKLWVTNFAGTILGSTTALTKNTWNHFAAVRNSGTLTLYVNGVASGSVSDSTSFSNTIYIGGRPSTQYFTGYMSNIRFVKGTAVYTTAFTPSTTPLTAITNTSLLTCQSNRFIDNSTNNFALTLTGTPSVQAYSPFGSIPEAIPISYSNYFNSGTSDVEIINQSTPIGTGDFTMECWVYPISTATNGYITTMTGASTIQGVGIAQDCVYLGWTSTYVETAWSSTPTVNTWTHLAVTRQGTTVRMFKNGVLDNTFTNAQNVSGTKVNVGRRLTDYGAYYATAYISNARIVIGNALYTATFTPSTTPLTAVSGTKILTCQSPTIIDNSSNAYTITTEGSPKVYKYNPFGYTAQSVASYTPSVHGGSAYFDGTTDYLSIPSNVTQFTFGTSDFTIEFWLYLNSTGQQIIWDGRPGSAAPTIYYYNSALRYYTNAADRIVGSSLSTGQWYHIALCRSSTNWSTKMFINGTQTGSTYSDSTTYTTSTPIIGADANTGQNYTFGLNGYLSDIRVTKGFALYTSNFVPPTQTLTNYSTTYPSSLLLNFNNGGIIDQHSSNVLESVGNAQLSTAVKKYNNASIYFDGTGDYLQRISPPSAMIQWWKGSYTLEYWIYANAFTQGGNTGGDPVIVGNMSPTGTGNQWSFGPISNGTVKFYYYNGSIQGFATTSTLSTGQWYHLAFVNNAGALAIYINGVSSATSTVSGTPSSDTATPFVIGSTNSASFNGYIDDLRVTPGVARYTANFTPPTSALITK